MSSDSLTTVPAKRTTTTPDRIAAADSYYLALDWESAGDGWQNALLACGVVFGDQLGNVIETKRFCRKVPPQEEFQSDTWDWWHQTPTARNNFFDGAAQLKRIDEQATFATTPEIVLAVYQYVTGFEARYGPFGRDYGNFIMLGDNVLFDYGRMDAILCLHALTRKPMRHAFKGYVKLRDPTEQLRALSELDRHKVNRAVTSPHSHDPVDDALHIYQMQCAIDRIVAARDKFEKEAAK